MLEKYQIVPYRKVFPKLRKALGVDFYSKFNYKVETNQGLVYRVDDKIIFLARNNHDCIILDSEKDLVDMIENDNFPIDEPEWNPYAREKERILKFHLYTAHYEEFLNRHLGFQFQQIDMKSTETFLSKVIGRTIKKVACEKETIGLISVVGQMFKERYPSKWIGTKSYGIYNSYLEPSLVTNYNRVIPVSELIESKLKWKVKNVDLIFKSINLFNKDQTEIGYDFDQYKRFKIIETIE